MMISVGDFLIGAAVETFMVAVAAGIVYRVWGGQFLFPKREVVLPNQRGVIVQGEHVVRVAEPGTCWVKPKQKIVLVDARPRPLQMAGLEVLGSDSGILRLSLSGEFQITDAATYYASSANANDALFVQIRRLLSVVARRQPAAVIAASADNFAAAVQIELSAEAASLGLSLTRFQVWDVAQLGFLRHNGTNSQHITTPQSGLVH